MLSHVLVNYRDIVTENKGRKKRGGERKQTNEGKTEGTCERDLSQ